MAQVVKETEREDAVNHGTNLGANLPNLARFSEVPSTNLSKRGWKTLSAAPRPGFSYKVPSIVVLVAKIDLPFVRAAPCIVKGPL